MRTSLHFFIVFLVLCISYRVGFLLEIKATQVVPFPVGLSSLALGFIDDISVGIVISLLLFVIQRGFQFLKSSPRLQRGMQILGNILICLLLIILAVDFLANRKLFFTLYTGSTYSLFLSAMQLGFTPDKYVEFMSLGDWVFIISSVILFAFMQSGKSPALTRLISKTVLSVTVIAIVLGMGNLMRVPFISDYMLIYMNPVTYAAQDILLPRENSYITRLDKPSDAQMRAVNFVDPVFISEKNSSILAKPQPTKNWNVVLIVLESVGLPYVHDKTYAASGPMPFMQELASHGMSLNNNYSGGNMSILGMFSLLTGLNTSPVQGRFEMNSHIHVPTLATWLGSKYDALFVMAHDKTIFFQPAIVENSGFGKVYDYLNIPYKDKTLLDTPKLNEYDAVSFFLSKMGAEKQPFLAVYWSNATHSPYPDFGPSHRLTSNITDIYARYYNNMNIVDQQIKRIYDFLAAKKLLDNTIIVVVGDHGEGFGQHKDGWFHGRTLYQEQIKVPVVFYQPKLFKPQVVNDLSSSTDILPTLLHAMSVTYNPHLMQGFPIVRGHVTHKYVFVYGYEDELATINHQQIKTQISFAHGLCRRYDLKNDPDERKPFACRHDEQEQAMIEYRNYQPNILKHLDIAMKQCGLLTNRSACLFPQ